MAILEKIFSRLVSMSKIAVLSLVLATSACDDPPAKTQKAEILAYIGITMAKPMSEIADLYQKTHNVKITITQGGSEDLYKSLKSSKVGDLYLPGSASYRENKLSEGLLGDFVLVGYNQAALMVPRGNPRDVKADVHELLRDDLAIVLCNPQSGSIGRETQRILRSVGIEQQAYDRAEFLTTDSRNLNKALRNGDADLILNWRATAFFDENRPTTEVLDLPRDLGQPEELVLNLLTFSKNPDIARDIMGFVTSPEGQAIFRRYGFIDAAGNSEK
jgi:molybdate transport system substrate-binding protein